MIKRSYFFETEEVFFFSNLANGHRQEQQSFSDAVNSFGAQVLVGWMGFVCNAKLSERRSLSWGLQLGTQNFGDV